MSDRVNVTLLLGEGTGGFRRAIDLTVRLAHVPVVGTAVPPAVGGP